MAPFFTGDGEARKSIAEDIDRACRETGFFAIVGHGVDEGLMRRARQMAVEFFALPTDEKLLVERPPQKVSRGYNRFMDRSLSYSIGLEAPPDLQEAFAFGPEEFSADDWQEGDPRSAMLAPNRWPERPKKNFRETMIEFDLAIRALGERMLDIVALALDVDRSYFHDKFDHQSSVARLVRYPAQKDAPVEGQLRAGEHTDFGTITFLRGDAVPGGTEVKTRSGAWITVETPPGGFVCNIGDALARWTNDRWVSTLHRVGNPPPAAQNVDRISLVHFHSPNHDAVIECIPGCEGPRGPKYEPITFADHYLGKVMKAAHARLNAKVADADAKTA